MELREILSLIIASNIQRVMKTQGLYKGHTMQTILDEMKFLMRNELKGRRRFIF